MNNKDKHTLYKFICSVIPYEVILSVTLVDKYEQLVVRDIRLTADNLIYIAKPSRWLEYKPYLRPMYSMTKEELKAYSLFSLSRHNEECFDWLNAHHFDYKGLIEKGLALVAPDGMYEINN